MRKNNVYLLMFFLCACASSRLNEMRDSSIKAYDSLHMGVSASNVIGILGKPDEIRDNPKDHSQDWWIYNEGQSQRGSINLDRTSQIVTSIMVIPKLTEPEEKLEYLLNNKFSSNSFAKFPLQRCSRDYVPMEEFYIDTQSGLLIVANRYSHDVQSFSRVSSDNARKLAEDIKSCRR